MSKPPPFRDPEWPDDVFFAAQSAVSPGNMLITEDEELASQVMKYLEHFGFQVTHTIEGKQHQIKGKIRRERPGFLQSHYKKD